MEKAEEIIDQQIFNLIKMQFLSDNTDEIAWFDKRIAEYRAMKDKLKEQ